jgi:dihydrofolate reductase
VVVHSLEEALARARDADGDEICVIGGGQIYRQALPLADRLNVTHVMADVAGDVRFPDIDPGAWKVVASEEWPAGEADSHPMVHTVYERR